MKNIKLVMQTKQWTVCLFNMKILLKYPSYLSI